MGTELLAFSWWSARQAAVWTVLSLGGYAWKGWMGEESSLQAFLASAERRGGSRKGGGALGVAPPDSYRNAKSFLN